MDTTEISTYTKYGVKQHEYDVHKYVYNLKLEKVNVPKIISYDKEKEIMVMHKIDAMNLSDMFGEKSSDIDEYYFDEIRTIIKTLSDNGIEYPDITGYNFIEHANKIWIIDFEHAHIRDTFVDKFIQGRNKWNPRFA
jgi:tRNA A-37 threonylcarbamoyl transferase component Bud32